jgi:DNA invertase Pin-like site-specific DNA recombinase
MNSSAHKITPGATAYSYVRFSRISQKQGRSRLRQQEGYEEWCAKHGIIPSDDTFLDEGKSGYTGDHVGPKGQLRRFLDLVEAGKIAKGSYLVVESLDRLGRDDINDALERFLGILNAGVRIVTLMDDERVYAKPFTMNDVLSSVVVMERANNESRTKAKRSRDNWKAAFEQARSPERKPVGKQVAMWLRLVEKDGKKVYEPDPIHKATVQRIFAECIAGHGFIAISKHLNADKAPAFRSDSWGSSSVQDVLMNRCVLGEWTPKDGGGTIPDYFPQIITPQTWELSQLAMDKRRRGDYTRQTSNFQVWQQVGYCSVCGSSMNLIQKGPAEHYKYLMCSRKRRGLCDKAINVRYDKSEEVFKELLVKVGALGLIQTEAAAITDEMALTDATIHKQETILTRHMQAAAEMDASPMIYRLITATEQEIKRLKVVRGELEAKHNAQTVAQSDKAWLLANLPLKERDDRQRANALLCRLGVTVDIAGGGTPSYMAMQNGKRLVQFIVTEGDIVTIPFNDDQRQKFKEQDVDGQDLANLNALLNRQIGPKSKAVSKS